MTYLIIWDWDNTLADTHDAVNAGLQQVALHFNLPPVTEDEVRNVMSQHRGTFWHHHFGDDIMPAVTYYMAHYPEHNDVVKLFSGATDILAYVQERGAQQIILSNKKHNTLVDECTRLGVMPYFARVIGSDEINGAKPSLEFSTYALQGLSYDKIIVIGDGESDMKMAENLGATAVWVKHETITEELPHTVLTHSLDEVFEYLKKVLG